MDEKPDDEWLPPSDIVDNSINHLEETKKNRLSEIDFLDNAIKTFKVGKGYWDNVDPETFRTTPAGISAYNSLGSVTLETSGLRQRSAEDLVQFQT